MSWRDVQRREQHRDWDAVDRALTTLPPRLFRQAKLLEYDLALRWSATGQFRDIFLGADAFPLSSIGRWVRVDLGVTPPDHRDEAGSHLLVAAVYLAMRTHLVEAIVDPSSFASREHVALIEVLAERTMAELAAVVPAGSPFWELRRSIAEDDVDDLLDDAERRRSSVAPDDPTALLRPRWSGPGRILADAAVASEPTAAAGHPGIEERVVAMLDALAEAVQIRDDLATMQRDLADERLTFPIAVTARSAGLSLEPWPAPPVVLGAMIATGSLRSILDTAAGRSLASRQIAVDAGLTTFVACLDDVIAGLDERRGIRTMGAVSSSALLERSDAATVAGQSGAGVAAGHATTRTAAPLFAPTEPTLPKAIAMAEGFLRADGALRESWEMHREGMFGPGDVWSRYPEGLVLEILAAHGHDVTALIDDFLSFTIANGFRYFAHPWSAVDSDTVGVFLRLLALATPDDRHLAAVEGVLCRLDAQVRDEGTIPVWITGDPETEAGRPPAMDLGEGCGTVAAHLLLGLLGITGHEETFGRGARNLLAGISSVGLGANVDYPPLYALARFEQLIGRLEGSVADDGVIASASAARPVLAGALERACARGPRSAQDAAMLTIACLEAGRPDMVDPAWRTTILKSQRFDGGWNGEPFAAAPNRGRSVTWYSSATLTTALCYDALRRGMSNGGHRETDHLPSASGT